MCVVSASLMMAGGSLAGQREYARDYQINPAHNGHITFANGFATPLAQSWTKDFACCQGISYPLIADGKVFVITYGNDVFALNVLTGDTVWERVLSGDNYAAAYDNGMLFLTNSSGQVIALDANNGKQKWSRTLYTNGSSYSQPPLAANGLVYVTYGSVLYALTELGGHQKWANVATDSASSPTLGGGNVYVSSGCNYFAFSATRGTLKWQTNPGGDCYSGGTYTPVYYDSRLYVVAGQQVSYILDALRGKVLGNFANGGYLPAFFKGTDKRRYQLTVANATLYCIDLKRGTVKWSYSGGNGGIAGAPIVVNNVAIVSSTYGGIAAVDSMTGAELWTSSSGDYGGSYLAAGEGVLAVSNGSTITIYAPQ
jgi:eukaryotic-like serine/threonine-protein kinase